MKKQLAIVLAVAALVGCKKNGGTEPDTATDGRPQLKLTRTLNGNEHFIKTEHVYNDKGLLQKEITQDEAAGIQIIQEYYYQNGKPDSSLIRLGNKLSSAMYYTYKADKLHKVEYYSSNEDGEMEYNYTLYYEYAANKLSKMYQSNDIVTYGYTEISYAGANISEVKGYSASGEPVSIEKYTYDQHLNPYYGNPGQLYFTLGFNENNITSATYTDYVEPEDSYEHHYVYEYDASKMPVKRFSVVGGTLVLNKTYTY